MCPSPLNPISPTDNPPDSTWSTFGHIDCTNWHSKPCTRYHFRKIGSNFQYQDRLIQENIRFTSICNTRCPAFGLHDVKSGAKSPEAYFDILSHPFRETILVKWTYLFAFAYSDHRLHSQSCHNVQTPKQEISLEIGFSHYMDLKFWPWLDTQWALIRFRVLYYPAQSSDLLLYCENSLENNEVNVQVDLSKYTIETYMRIVTYKTAYYSFYLPVACGLILAGRTESKDFEVAQEICLQMGQYFQVLSLLENTKQKPLSISDPPFLINFMSFCDALLKTCPSSFSWQ